jgi:hypothetical protein
MPTAAPCSSTRSANCRSNCNPSCCACSKTANTSASAKPRRASRRRASSPPPIATCARKSAPAASAPTSTTACRSSPSPCPACAKWAMTACCLLEHFARLYADKAQRPPFTLSPAARQLWMAYSFPGNVRELRNIVIRLAASHAGQEVGADRLRSEFDSEDEVDQRREPRAGRRRSGSGTPGGAPPSGKRRTPRPRCHAGTMGTRLHGSRHRTERRQHEPAARRLGINRTTLYNRLEGRNRR